MSTETTDSIVIETKIAEYSPTAAGLAELAHRLQGRAYDLTTTKGDKEARADRLECVRLRTSLEAKRKELKAPALERSRLIDDEAKRITAAILDLETPIDEQIKAVEMKKEADRLAKIEAERKRVAWLRERVWGIQQFAASCVGLPSVKIAALLETLQAEVVDDSFAELKDEAEKVKAETLGRVRELHSAALAQEAEAARLAAERIELARLRAEQAERDRVERERLAAEALAQREQLELEQAAARAEQAAARAAQEAADRAAKTARDEADRKAANERAEADRIAREAREAEAIRQESVRAELQRQERAAAAERRRLEDAATAKRERTERAAPALLAALVIAVPYVAQHGTPEDLAQCNAAIADAT